MKELSFHKNIALSFNFVIKIFYNYKYVSSGFMFTWVLKVLFLQQENLVLELFLIVYRARIVFCLVP